MSSRSNQYKTWKSLPSTSLEKKNNSQTLNNTSSPPCLEIQDSLHKKNIVRDNKIVCIKFHADWCGPCQAIKSKYNELSYKWKTQGVLLVSENADLKITSDYPVNGIPAFIFYKNGQLVHNKGKILSIVGGNLNSVERVLYKLTEK